MSDLAYKRTNVYEQADDKLMKEIFRLRGGVSEIHRRRKDGAGSVRLCRKGGEKAWI